MVFAYKLITLFCGNDVIAAPIQGEVRAGDHLVEFRFWPANLTMAFVASACGLIACCALFWAGRRAANEAPGATSPPAAS